MISVVWAIFLCPRLSSFHPDKFTINRIKHSNYIKVKTKGQSQIAHQVFRCSATFSVFKCFYSRRWSISRSFDSCIVWWPVLRQSENIISQHHCRSNSLFFIRLQYKLLVALFTPTTVEPLDTDTSLLRTVSNVLTKFWYIFFKKTLYDTDSLKRTTDTKSRPQGVHSSLRKLRWSGAESRIPIRWFAQGESRLADELCKVISKAQSLYIKQRFAKGVQRNITGFFKAWMTTDSIENFSVTLCTLETVYCTWKVATKDASELCLRLQLFKFSISL